VRDQIPELRVPDVPADPSLYANWVGSLPSLIVLQQTTEDLQRTQQYHEARTREAYRGAVGSLEDFLRGLDLRVEVRLVGEESMSRVVQLLAKTNQFTLTTRRHDEATIRRQVSSGAWRVYTMRLADRFGDFGLTGVAIVAPDPEVWHLDSFLLSCRVIGKSVETALLARIAADARAGGAVALSAEFLDSGRNKVASMFLSNHGFAAGSDGQWHRSLESPGPDWPAWVAAVGPESAATAGAAGGPR
jgi:FkbH-like protein